MPVCSVGLTHFGIGQLVYVADMGGCNSVSQWDMLEVEQSVHAQHMHAFVFVTGSRRQPHSYICPGEI